jgi:hypothetical protein
LAVKPVAAFIIGQSIGLGLLVAFLVVPGSAVFLDVYGPERLPFVYLIVAAAGALVSYGLTSLQSRYGLYQLAISTTLLMALSILACWMLLVFAGAQWTSFGVLVLFALQLQLGFVFIGAQAGRAFDIQEIKRIFPRIVAGFVFGFMVGGFVAAGFVHLVGNATHLLAASSAVTALTALLMVGASRYVNKAAAPETAVADETSHLSLRKILGVPLVSAVFAYQILSAMGTQLIEYLVYDRAAARYSGPHKLAEFMGEFTAVLNLTDLLVLVLLAGLLMSRFGLRFGLGANPLMVTGLVAVAIVVALISGPDATLFFLLVAVARISDITMADAATRTSVNATFKALPERQRLAAQVGVEGAGVPIALGLTALLILAINAVPGSTVVDIVTATLILCILWSAAAWVVYRRYQAAVVVAVRRRTLDGYLVDLTEPVTRQAIGALCLSDDPRDVRVGAQLLAGAHDANADKVLRHAAENPSIDVQAAVLDHLVVRDPELAHQIASRCVASGSSAHAVHGMRILGQLSDFPYRPLVEAFLTDDEPRLRAVAVGTVLRRGDESDGLVETLATAAGSAAPEDRRFAAMALAEAGREPSIGLIANLLADRDQAVLAEANAAVASLNDRQRFELLELPLGLRERTLFLRACRQSASLDFAAAVAADLANNGAPVAELVRVLASSDWRGGENDRDTIGRLVDDKIRQIETARGWIDKLDGSALVTPESTLRLGRALITESIEAGRELTDLLGLIYDRKLMARVGRILRGTTGGDLGMALESLDVALSSEHRAPVIRALKKAFDGSIGDTGIRGPVGRSQRKQELKELAGSCGWATHKDWLQACALALLVELGVDHSELGAILPMGPVSSELTTVR